jgi:hypothetical protein
MALFSHAAALAPPLAPSAPANPSQLPGRSQLVIVAAGGRDLTWPPAVIAAHLLQAAAARLVVALLHGAARGADQAIASAADQLGWPQIACPASWAEHGRAAGPIRNRQMLQRSIDLVASLPAGASLLVIAFPGARGTASLLEQARRLMRRSALPVAVQQIAAAP